MYIPTAFAVSDRKLLEAFIERNPFATVITSSDQEPKISHLPMYYLEENGKGFLVGHLSKANDHWQSLAGKSTVVFHGPHAYVSSAWYAKANVVPTWNYITVHVSGLLSTVDGAELGSILDLMVRKHEGDLESFRLNLGEEARAHMEKRIVGVKMEIEKMEGKWKLSQDKSPDIQEKVVAKLLEAADEPSREIGRIMAANLGKAKP